MDIEELPAMLTRELGGEKHPDGFVRVLDRAFVKVIEHSASTELLIWFWTLSPVLFFRTGRSAGLCDVSIGVGSYPTGIWSAGKGYQLQERILIDTHESSVMPTDYLNRLFVMQKIMDQLVAIVRSNPFEVATSFESELEIPPQ